MSDKKELVTAKGELQGNNKHLRKVVPLVDVYENDEEILLHADLPGVARENIYVNIEGGRLRLEGTRNLSQNGAVRWEEFGDVHYMREFSVPQTIDVDKVSAELRDGVLQLHLPKTEAAKPRQIEIRTA